MRTSWKITIREYVQDELQLYIFMSSEIYKKKINLEFQDAQEDYLFGSMVYQESQREKL